MTILSIETSCDETGVAITKERKVVANTIYSQVLIHKKWGGVVPSLAKRAHKEKIDLVINQTLNKFARNQKILKSHIFSKINYIAVTQGPGLAPALEIGIKKAKDLAKKHQKKLIAVNHLEGHLYSPFVQNQKGNPKKNISFPYLALIVSGGHTELVIFRDHLKYDVIGTTLDDAAGEALDKGAKMLNLGYPGGKVIEQLAKEVDNQDNYKFPRPMIKKNNLDFSFSGLKTAFYYFLKKQTQDYINKNLKLLASSFQQAVFDTLVIKTEKAINQTGINQLIIGGGVSANMYLRKKIRNLIKNYKGQSHFPSYKYLTGDNGAMIGVVAYYKAKKNLFIKNIDKLDRIPRMKLSKFY